MERASRSNLLEPVLITYNRATQLAETLAAFRKGGWAARVFHVLDNASTDSTRETVESFQHDWPGLQYHSNAWNIGGNANILRAVEISCSEYHWVIGDDDAWSFASADELAMVLEEGQADIIRLGWLAEDFSRGRYLPAADLARKERLFFSSTSMISATIIRRSLVTCCLAESYQNIGNTFPQLVAIMRGCVSGAKVYTLSQDYMTHTPNREAGYFFGDLEIYAAWYATGRYLPDSPLKTAFLHEFTHLMTMKRRGILKNFIWFAKVALNGKGLGVSQTPYLLSMLGNGRGGRLPVVFAALVYLAVPGVLARQLRCIYRKITGLPTTEVGADRSRL